MKPRRRRGGGRSAGGCPDDRLPGRSAPRGGGAPRRGSSCAPRGSARGYGLWLLGIRAPQKDPPALSRSRGFGSVLLPPTVRVMREAQPQRIVMEHHLAECGLEAIDVDVGVHLEQKGLVPALGSSSRGCPTLSSLEPVLSVRGPRRRRRRSPRDRTPRGGAPSRCAAAALHASRGRLAAGVRNRSHRDLDNAGGSFCGARCRAARGHNHARYRAAGATRAPARGASSARRTSTWESVVRAASC